MKSTITLFMTIMLSVNITAQIITFDDQGYTNSQQLGNPYTIVNNGETFLFTISGSTNSTTQHRYVTQESSCSSTGLGHITAGTFPATTWTIETASGNEINLGTIRFDNVFSCFSFEYSLIIEGFKDNLSTGSQSFTTNGLNSVFSSNSSFDEVDKIMISASDLGNLGIDDINWTMATLSNDAFLSEDEVTFDINSDFIKIRFNNQLVFNNYTIYNLTGAEVSSGEQSEIYTATLASGIYILKLNFDKGIVTKKVNVY